MARNSNAFVEDLDGGVGEPRLDGLTQQPERHRVVMMVDLDVVVGRDTTALPFSISIGFARQLLECRTVDRLQQLPSALGELVHYVGVDRRNAFADFRVQLVEREE